MKRVEFSLPLLAPQDGIIHSTTEFTWMLLSKHDFSIRNKYIDTKKDGYLP